MNKGERTRAKLVQTAAELLQRQGFAGTGLAAVVAESGAPRGSLYFHFPGGKEELAVAALTEAGAAWRARLEAVIARAPSLAQAVRDVCDVLGAELEASAFTLGCPLATVALEAPADAPAVRATCEAHFRGWEASIAEYLVRAGASPNRAAELATFTLAAMEGALLLAKVKRDAAPLRQVGETLALLVGMLVPPAPAPGPGL